MSNFAELCFKLYSPFLFSFFFNYFFFLEKKNNFDEFSIPFFLSFSFRPLDDARIKRGDGWSGYYGLLNI